ncbi:MAG: PRC-barrel domain-containing protein [Candidatus Hadarchaeum sp.]|uniref:PRC-barrel domain-containing protein n=1 Tax=Candidatus Hadarchaeum sp. TaxID=2883567 RepID=UPI00317F0C15
MAEVEVVQILASKLRSVGVITDRGLQLGRVSDIIFDEKDGRIISLIVKPTSREVLGTIQRDESGNALVPFSAVMSIRDYVVVNERVLAIQQLKAQPKTAPQTLPPALPPLPPKE